MPQKLLTLCHCYVAETVLTWMCKSSVCFVLFLRLQTWKPGWDRPVVTLIQVCSTAGVTAKDSFVTWKRPARSGLLVRLLNTVGSFAKKAGAQRLILMRVQATGIFKASIWTVAHRWKVFVMPNFEGGSADMKNASHPMRIPRWLQAFFAVPAVLASEVGFTGRTVDQKMSCSRFL